MGPSLPATAIDLGASRTVVAVRELPAGEAPADPAEWDGAWRVTGLRPPAGAGPVALDRAVAGDPVTAAEAWRCALERAPLARHGLKVAIEDDRRTAPARPAARRDRVAVAAGTEARVVGLRTDAAVAVAGHHLMRRLGADPAIGVEAFRCRARLPGGRRAGDDPGAWAAAGEWHENWLVVDVGAASTACALVRVLLAGRGRATTVALRVLASGGRADLGGDQLTRAVHRDLARRLGPGGVPDPAHLWAAAEQVTRVGLAREAARAVTVRITPAEGPGTAVTTAVTLRGHEVAVPGQGHRSLTVSGDRLADLATPLLDRIAALASGIARAGGPHEADRELDAVVLSGGSLLAGHLRARLEARLRAQADADGLGPAFDVAFDADHARTATALGALFLATTGPPGMADGRVRVTVDDSHLHAILAADFEVLVAGRPVTLFRRGDALAAGGAGHRARSPVLPVQQRITVHRVDYRDGERRVGVAWGAYELDPAVLDADAATGVRMAFEIDELERITLVLRKGSGPARLDLTGGAPFDPPPPPLVAGGRLTADLFDRAVDPRLGPTYHHPALRAGEPVGRGLARRIEQSQVWISSRGPERHRLLVMPEDRPWLSIDAAGVARHHAAEPPELTVATVEALLAAPDGACFRTALRAPDPDGRVP